MKNEDLTVYFKTPQDAKDFISDLKETSKKALRNGGEYRAWRQDEKGRKLIFNCHYKGVF